MITNEETKGDSMAWDRTWRCRNKGLRWDDFNKAVVAVVQSYKGVQGTVEKEADDCWTCFFTVTGEEESEVSTYEISLYNMGKDGFVLSLEADASDNQLSDDADQLAEDLASELNAIPLEL
jgi:hypothetical protein